MANTTQDTLSLDLQQKLLNAQQINQTNPQDISEPVTVSVTGLLLETVIGLAIVIGLIFLTVYLFKKLQGAKWMSENQQAIDMEILQNKMLGPQQRIVLAKIGSDFMLLGVTNENINLIKMIDSSQIDQDFTENQAVGQEFSQSVNQLLAKFRKDGGVKS